MTKDIFYNRVTEDNCMVEGENGKMVPNYDLTIIDFDEGDILKGRVVKIDKDEILVDVGFKSEGVIPNNELSIRNNAKPGNTLNLGDIIEIMVVTKEDQEGRLILSKRRAEIEKSFDMVEKIYESDDTIEGEVIEYVRGGLILDIGLRGFLPASLIDVKKVKELSDYIGEKCVCKIIEVDRNRNNVVLSRKAIIEDQRRNQRKEILENIEVGQIRKGIVTSIADFGAFVDVDGVDGLVHISELSWDHVKHPSEVVKINDEVSVEILDVDYEKQRLSLGLKQTQKDPWVEKIKKYSINSIVQGKVTRIVKFGLFVQIEEGMEGLVHISELSTEQIRRPGDVAKVGDELIVKIIDIDYDKRRMALSAKQVTSPSSEEENKEKKEKIKSKESPEADTEKSPETDSKEKTPSDSEVGSDKKLDEISPAEKKKAIKNLLEEMKSEANIE
jgi:small subunit ribosomal protein S1